MILTQLLNNAKMDDIKRLLENQFATSNGMLILNAMRDAILPASSLKIVDLLTELGGCVHRNKDTVALGLDRLNHILTQIKDLGYVTIDDLRVAYAQRFFLHRAYSDIDSLKMLQDRLKNKLVQLYSGTCSNEFGKEIQSCFENFEVQKDGEMISLPVNAVRGISRRVLGSNSFSPQSTDADDKDMVPSTQSSFQPFLPQQAVADPFEECPKMFRATQCPCCCITRSSPDDHYMSNCKTLKRLGYNITYDPKKDERRPAYEKEQNQQQRNAEKEKEDAEKAEAAKQKKAAAAKKKADEAKKKAAAAKKKEEEEEANGDDSDLGTPAGTARCDRHLHANCFGALATDIDSDSEP